MKIIETLKDIITPLIDHEKPPLHVGEVMHLWWLLQNTELTLRLYQVGYNTTEDAELKEKLNQLIHDVLTPISNDIKELLHKEGVPLPKATPNKTLTNDAVSELHPGIKLSDEEIANLMVYTFVEHMRVAVKAIIDSTRVDVALIFAKFQALEMSYLVTFKPLMEERGWLNEPNYFNS